MNERQFWLPELFIPTLGLLLGVTAGAMAVGLSTVLKKVGQQSDMIDMYLSFGASRWEAGRIAAVEAIRLALLPTINRMSVIGLITIPGGKFLRKSYFISSTSSRLTRHYFSYDWSNSWWGEYYECGSISANYYIYGISNNEFRGSVNCLRKSDLFYAILFF